MKHKVIAAIAACILTFAIVDSINHGMRAQHVEQA